MRVNNEDACFSFAGDRQTPAFAVVADGMGGLLGGEEASAVAVEAIRVWMNSADNVIADAQDMATALEFAHQRVMQCASELNYVGKMGTTLMLWVMLPGQNVSMYAHVGDSRCYALENGALTQVSKDHTVTQRLVDSGLLAPARAPYHNKKHVLTQGIGLPGVIVPEANHLPTAQRILLCSDGLSDLVPIAKLNELINIEDADDAATAMLRTALDAGGRDNITLILIDLES